MKTTSCLVIALASLMVGDWFAVHSAAGQTPGTAVRPPSSVIAELQQSLAERPNDALLMGRLASEYQQTGRWKAGYQLAMSRLATAPQDAAALYDAGAAAFWVITAGKQQLTTQEIGQIAEEGVQNLGRAISQLRDFTSAMIYKSKLYREQSKLASDANESARLQTLAAAAMNEAIQTKRPGTAAEFPRGVFAAPPIVVIPTELSSQDLLPPGSATFITAPTQVPRQIGRIVEEPRATSGATDQNSSFSIDPQVLSPNPAGYNFGPFLFDALNRLRTSWYAVMPEAARRGEKGRVDFMLTIMRDGTVQDLKLLIPSGNQALDQAAEAAIQQSRFAPIPAGFQGDQLRLRMAFLYNTKSGER